jgi:hypothetical protein
LANTKKGSRNQDLTRGSLFILAVCPEITNASILPGVMGQAQSLRMEQATENLVRELTEERQEQQEQQRENPHTQSCEGQTQNPCTCRFPQEQQCTCHQKSTNPVENYIEEIRQLNQRNSSQNRQYLAHSHSSKTGMSNLSCNSTPTSKSATKSSTSAQNEQQNSRHCYSDTTHTPPSYLQALCSSREKPNRQQ